MTDPGVPVHVPVLLAPVLAAAAGARRAVDATLGDGGHAEALRAAGRRGAGHRPRPGRDRGEPPAPGRGGIRVPSGRHTRPPRPWPRSPPSTRTSSCWIWACRPANWTRRHADLLSVRARRWTCAWARTARSAADAAQRGRGSRARPDLRTSTATSARRGAWPGRSCAAAGAAAVRHQRRSGQRDTRRARARGPGPPDFARLFQAVRIAVNDELDGLDSVLSGVPRRARRRAAGWRSSPIIPARTGWSSRRSASGPARASVRRGSRCVPAAGRASGRLSRESRSCRTRTRWRPIPARAAPSCGSSRRPMRLKGRHWLMLWLLFFLCVLVAITTRQTAASARRGGCASCARSAWRSRPAGPTSSGGSALASSRQVLVPIVERALGLHEPADSEFVLFAVPAGRTASR